MRRLLLLLPVLGVLASCSPPKPKVGGMVLVVADGTSLELLAATRFHRGGAEGRLALDGLPFSAIVRTASASHLVTDSSAAATALARGIKADNRMVGMANAAAVSSPPSILDLAKQAGWTTAVVTDDSVTGGTSSPFVVEHPNRNEHDAIAGKMVEQLGSRVDLLAGGGAQWFIDRSETPGVVYKPGQLESVRKTHSALSASEVEVFESWESYQSKAAGPISRPVLAVLAPDVFSYYADGQRSLRLKDMVEKTVRILEAQGKPFLLVVEASLPDKASHLNNARRAIAEVMELDAVIEWLTANLRPDVFLLATTDHNTGGIVVNGYPPARFQGERIFGTDPLSGANILTWASGPGADLAVANVRRRLVSEPGQAPREILEDKAPTDPDFVQPALLKGKGSLHTGGDVWAFAYGPGADRVRGSLDNTELYGIMAGVIPPAR